jgi:hypothetical protein
MLGSSPALRRYLSATGAPRGALVFMSLGEIVWVQHVDASCCEAGPAESHGRG